MTIFFGNLFKNFCLDHDLSILDQDILPDNSFTYLTDCHGTTSWIDHCLCSFSLHHIITQMEVMHNVITSDHRPLAFIMYPPNLPLFVSSALTVCHTKLLGIK